jgi:RNA polymerase sigma-70 factor, ECF subfamily
MFEARSGFEAAPLKPGGPQTYGGPPAQRACRKRSGLLRVGSVQPAQAVRSFLHSVDDAGLLTRARAGDGAAFHAIFLRHGPSVRRFLGVLLRDETESDEATQETFVRAHQALGSLREPERLGKWLLGIARIVWLDHCGRQRRLARYPLHLQEDAPAPAADGRAMDAEASKVLAAALGKLSPERQAAVALRLDQGLGYNEIAEALGWPLHKVKNELHRARLAIRGELLDYLEGRP